MQEDTRQFPSPPSYQSAPSPSTLLKTLQKSCSLMISVSFKLVFQWLFGETLQGWMKILQCVCDRHAHVKLQQIKQMAFCLIFIYFLTVGIGM